ncbi:tRNA 2-thiocytidine biosynthesis TtcA family protein [uncultured Treponema sp.]|uniref:tRNA 2-thiocytidine biosynthesis TtcA family protein n=1 Tax=uncultured Treponema sp. TaxID=162155 RepID=UPI0015BDFF75|nr:tRNA 2-thiocytidine biosynthesis TtcA family protein [uncultured Treponema sp.]
MPQPFLYNLIDKAIFDYRIIEKGDRILVGASGGKDSTALIEYFAARKKRQKDDFEFLALNVCTDFGGGLPEGIKTLFEEWNVPLESVFVDVNGRLKEGYKMSCYWCSTQRRKELIAFAEEKGFNKIALGHHMDDILETALMNALGKGELSTMIPSLKYDKYPLTIVRPLCYADEKTIIEHAKKGGYFGWTCTCNYQDNSARKTARRRLELLTEGDRKAKERLFKALKNVKKDYLP